MPPRKKNRLPSRAASTPSGDVVGHETDQISTLAKNDVVDKPILPDAWTDEQETSLWKGVVRWKPVGLLPKSRVDDPTRNVTLMKPARHAQAFQNDSDLSTSKKPWLHFGKR